MGAASACASTAFMARQSLFKFNELPAHVAITKAPVTMRRTVSKSFCSDCICQSLWTIWEAFVMPLERFLDPVLRRAVAQCTHNLWPHRAAHLTTWNVADDADALAELMGVRGRRSRTSDWLWGS